jgi:hypothetical protein
MLVGLPTPDLRPDVAFCPQKAEFHLHFEDCFGAPMSNAKARHPQITPYVSQALEPSQKFCLLSRRGIHGTSTGYSGLSA